MAICCLKKLLMKRHCCYSLGRIAFTFLHFDVGGSCSLLFLVNLPKNDVVSHRRKEGKARKYHKVKGQVWNPKLAMEVTFHSRCLFQQLIGVCQQFPVWEWFSRLFFPRFGRGFWKKMHQVSRNSVLCGSQNITLVGNSVIMYGGQVFPDGPDMSRQVSLVASSWEQHLGDKWTPM